MPLSRRDFLKKVGLVTGAAVAAPVLSKLPDFSEPEPEIDPRLLEELANPPTVYYYEPEDTSYFAFEVSGLTRNYFLYDNERIKWLDSSSG